MATDTYPALYTLTMCNDGIDALDLGVVGECQYALTFVRPTAVLADARGNLPRPTAAEVFRRRASDVGTYGGWRWECASNHPARYPMLPNMAELAERIASAIMLQRFPLPMKRTEA